ncbi:EFR1 family ferrodoxin [Clostridium botulinum]|nr:EFR1 family ferrodoxin [Clostridium botulinum]
MLERKPISIYYFTGTGNTYLIVQEIYKSFKNRGYEIHLIPITDESNKQFKTDNIIGLAFPVAVQSTNPLVWDFIKKMPDTEGTKVFMLDTMQAFSGGVVGPMKKLLIKKGYNCIGAKEFIMPNNMRKTHKDGLDKIIKKSKIKAEQYVEDLINETSKWRRIAIFSDLMRLCSLPSSLWKSMYKQFTIDRDKCVKCGQCEMLCPTSSIKLQKGGYPVYKESCISCMRCANYCPKNAIKVKGKYLVQNRPIKPKDFCDN